MRPERFHEDLCLSGAFALSLLFFPHLIWMAYHFANVLLLGLELLWTELLAVQRQEAVDSLSFV